MVELTYPNVTPPWDSPASKLATKFYHEHLTSEQRGKVKLWRDPEEYLDRIDNATIQGRESPEWEFLDGQIGSSPDWNSMGRDFQDLGFAARRWMAAECSAFVTNADPESERWEAHRGWASQLDASHTVITFNYDLVLERLFDPNCAWWRARSRPPFHLVRPDTTAGERTAETSVVIYKLHGSVNWQRHEDGTYAESAEPFAATRAKNGHEMGIATPGPNKREMVKEFDALWNGACGALIQAARVAFVGYRFPDTDAYARKRLLQAIGKSCEADNLRSVHTVLGPNVDKDPSSRLIRLLTAASGHCPVTAFPFYCEEFFTLYDITPDLYDLSDAVGMERS
jgi:hypothetical protein